MPYPNSEDNRVGTATICPISLLAQEIKASTSATGKHIAYIRSVALLKVLVNKPIPNTGKPGVILELYLTYS